MVGLCFSGIANDALEECKGCVDEEFFKQIELFQDNLAQDLTENENNASLPATKQHKKKTQKNLLVPEPRVPNPTTPPTRH